MDASRQLRRFVLVSAAASILVADSGEDLLKRVDRYRYPWPEFSVDVSLQDGKTKQQWRVLVRENGDARVDGLSEKEKGRTVLLLKEDMWLLLPNAKRPVKVAPQQRLLGPAAGGDVARFRFSGDYALVQEREEMLDGKPSRRLELQAKSKKLTYQTAVLWINREGGPAPVGLLLRLRQARPHRPVWCPIARNGCAGAFQPAPRRAFGPERRSRIQPLETRPRRRTALPAS